LFNFAIKLFQSAAGRKLNSIECHDLVCKIADIVVVGGVRRAALIYLSNLNDQRMREAKSGQWWVIDPQRALANNSVCYTEKPDIGIFMVEWKSL
jgi:ribonucleoside-triphosphate reductase